MFTIVVSIIEFLVKIATVGILFVAETDCKSALTNISGNIKSIFKGPGQYEQI
jgi:hypothetical protein